MDKKIILFVAFFIMINFSSALKISISPAEISINANTKEKVCKTIELSSDPNIYLTGEDKWIAKGLMSRELLKYNLTSRELSIETYYEKEIYATKKKKVEFCLTGTRPGVYYGSLVYSREDVGVGTWIRANISDNTINLVTGAASGVGSKNNLSVVAIFIGILVFLALLVYFISILRKR